MNYKYIYKTPDGFSDLIMNSDGEYLTGLWFENSIDALKHNKESEEKNLEIFKQTKKWLDIYFAGKQPNFTPKYKISNLTEFRREVLCMLNSIKFGKTASYNDISKAIATKQGIKKMSNRAVGSAVGWNPICIIIPCHRVVGKNGNLTGFGGGIENKIKLLAHEKNDMTKFFLPKTNHQKAK